MKVDALIAGGGPAGLSAAISASNRGCDVVLIEKCKEIGKIIRTSGLSWIEEINDFDIPSSFYNPLKKYYMYSPNNKISLETENPKACVLDITKLYQHLAQKASTAGARIQLYRLA